MRHPRPPRRDRPAWTRRGALTLALLGAATASGCGPVRLGSPAPYTPPPPGIDDLFRTDLLTLLDQALAGTRGILEAAQGVPLEDPEESAALGDLQQALPQQRAALVTGAEAEREAEEAQDSPGATPTPPPGTPQDVTALIEVLVELRDLATDAARQISGSLARPVLAIAAHTTWVTRRLHRAAGEGTLAPPRTAEEIVPTREVPTSDPPSVGARSDYEAAIERAQQEEWYAGYVHEVLAARSEDESRERHLVLSERHRERAAELGKIAAEDDAPVVARQAVYPLPGGTLTPEVAGPLPAALAEGLLRDHLSLAGAAPFERRVVPIAAALQEAVELADLRGSLPPLPSLVIDEDDAV